MPGRLSKMHPASIKTLGLPIPEVEKLLVWGTLTDKADPDG